MTDVASDDALAVRAFFQDLEVLGLLARLEVKEPRSTRRPSLCRPAPRCGMRTRNGQAVGHASREPLRRWGHLHVGARIGAGSYSTVHRAYDPRLDREVALKLMAAAPHAAARARGLLDEARHLMRVRHRNVVSVLGAGVHGSRAGIWMDLIEGETLADRLAASGPLDPARAAAIGCDVCRALESVHAAGLVHGDVKPQNVMLERGGRTVLIDFGASGGPNVTAQRLRRLSGTPLYLAPELLAGAAPSAASDVYAVGVLLYHAVTNGYPVVADDLGALAAAHRSAGTRFLETSRPDLPPAFRRAVDGALSARPEARPHSARRLCAALRRSLDVPAEQARRTASRGAPVQRPKSS